MVVLINKYNKEDVRALTFEHAQAFLTLISKTKEPDLFSIDPKCNYTLKDGKIIKNEAVQDESGSSGSVSKRTGKQRSTKKNTASKGLPE